MVRVMRYVKWVVAVVVLLFIVALVHGLMAAHGAFARTLPASQAPAAEVDAGAPGHKIAGRMLVEGTPDARLPLVVLLHGDAPGRNPSYQYDVAHDVAAAAPGARVVALMRPGYTDLFGAHSDGWRGFASGENYTRDVVDDLAAAIAELKQRYGAPAVVLAGHSGGATIAADIAALHPGLVQHVVLVACPCDVPRFRKHMAKLQMSPVWLWPVRSLSPLETVSQMQPGTQITAITGANDPLALPEYAEAYVAAAKQRGLTAEVTLLPGEQHEIYDEKPVIAAIAQAAQKP